MKNQPSPFVKNLMRLSFLLLLCFPQSCVDQINLEIPDGTQEAVVIQATLVKGDPSEIKVQISRLFNFTIASFNPLDADEVLLHNDEGQSLALTKRGIGAYEAFIPHEDQSFLIEHFKKYQLEVRLDANRSFLSEMEPLLPVPTMDSISVEVIEKLVADPRELEETILDTFVRFSLHTPLLAAGQAQPSRVRWITERTAKVTERVKSRREIEEGFPQTHLLYHRR